MRELSPAHSLLQRLRMLRLSQQHTLEQHCPKLSSLSGRTNPHQRHLQLLTRYLLEQNQLHNMFRPQIFQPHSASLRILPKPYDLRSYDQQLRALSHRYSFLQRDAVHHLQLHPTLQHNFKNMRIVSFEHGLQPFDQQLCMSLWHVLEQLCLCALSHSSVLGLQHSPVFILSRWPSLRPDQQSVRTLSFCDSFVPEPHLCGMSCQQLLRIDHAQLCSLSRWSRLQRCFGKMCVSQMIV